MFKHQGDSFLAKIQVLHYPHTGLVKNMQARCKHAEFAWFTHYSLPCKRHTNLLFEHLNTSRCITGKCKNLFSIFDDANLQRHHHRAAFASRSRRGRER